MTITGIERGMIFWAEVLKSDTKGSERCHDSPDVWVVVSSNDVHQAIPIVQAVPLTSQVRKYKGDFRWFRILIPKKQTTRYATDGTQRELEDIERIANTEQLRVLSHERLLGDPVGRLSYQALTAIEAGMCFTLGIPPI